VKAVAKQSETIARAAQILRPPLEKAYSSLSDYQKLSLNDVDPQPQNVSLPHAQDQSNENRTNLKVGERVKLRSGGPLMAVLSVSGTDVTCVWFNAVGQAEIGTFPAASLASLTDDQKAVAEKSGPAAAGHLVAPRSRSKQLEPNQLERWSAGKVEVRRSIDGSVIGQRY
jgi:uncharacterized protein YodC (DUF2158 family)